MDYEAELAMVRRHIADGERHVGRQREIVDGLRKVGGASALAASLLDEFEDTLAEHRRHLDRLIAEPR